MSTRKVTKSDDALTLSMPSAVSGTNSFIPSQLFRCIVVLENLPIVDLKLVLLGNSHVGKTSVFNRYVYGEFTHTSETIGVHSLRKRVEKTSDLFQFSSIIRYFNRRKGNIPQPITHSMFRPILACGRSHWKMRLAIWPFGTPRGKRNLTVWPTFTVVSPELPSLCMMWHRLQVSIVYDGLWRKSIRRRKRDVRTCWFLSYSILFLFCARFSHTPSNCSDYFPPATLQKAYLPWFCFCSLFFGDVFQKWCMLGGQQVGPGGGQPQASSSAHCHRREVRHERGCHVHGSVREDRQLRESRVRSSGETRVRPASWDDLSLTNSLGFSPRSAQNSRNWQIALLWLSAVCFVVFFFAFCCFVFVRFVVRPFYRILLI